MTDTDAIGVFGQWAPKYIEAGWHGVMPLPMKCKAPPPAGTTGATGRFPAPEQVEDWMRTMARGNIAVRLAEDVIGIDVDAYGAKSGADTLAIATEKWGTLPPTWRTTSRTDGTSGIRFYRTEPGLAWPGEVGPGIEVVQYRHRYAVVPPSVHPEGGTYTWLHDDGRGAITPPRVDDLPWLPTTWTQGLTNGVRAVESNRVQMDLTTARAWLDERERASNSPCARMRSTLNTFTATLESGSAHTAARTLTSQAIRLTDDGHRGALEVLGRAWQAFSDEVTTDGRGMVRSEWEARHEWDSLLASAVGLVAGDGHDFPVCDCDPQALAEWLGGPEATVRTADDVPAPPLAAMAPAAEPLTLPYTSPANVSPEDDERDDDWSPVDLAAIISGEYEMPEPTALHRADGRAMWYPGKVNGLLGASESGKTWIAYLAMRQTVQRGGRVTLIDFEDTPTSFVARMDTLGIDDDEWERISVIAPVSPYTAASRASLYAHLDEHQPDLVIVDGFNAAMTASGLDLMSNEEVTRFFQAFLTPLAKTGAAVAYIDHVVKNRSDDSAPGGIGAQAKRAMTSGCTLMVEVRIQPAPGKVGILDLYVDKDRPGAVREYSKPNARGQWVGTVTFDSLERHMLDLLFTSPDPLDEANPDMDEDVSIKVSPAERIRKDMLALIDQHRQVTGAQLKNVRGRRSIVSDVLDELLDEGYITVVRQGVNVGQTIYQAHYVSQITPPQVRNHSTPEKPQDAPAIPDTPEKGQDLTRNAERPLLSLQSSIEKTPPSDTRRLPGERPLGSESRGGKASKLSSIEAMTPRARARLDDPFAEYSTTAPPDPEPSPPLGGFAGAHPPGSLAPSGPEAPPLVCQHCGTIDPKVGYKNQCQSCYYPVDGSQWR